MGSFLLNKLNFTIAVIIAGLIALDINKHGNFKGSKTGVFLRDSGVLQYGEQAFTKLRSYSQQAYRWSQKHVPGYVTRARENFIPYLIIVKDMLITLAVQLWTNIKLVVQYFVDMKPRAVQWINQYAPGLTDSVGLWFTRAWTLLKDYAIKLTALVLKYLSAVMQWIKDNVFVGKLSPENLQRYTMQAVNTTRTIAVQTISWFNSKVVTVSSAA